MLGELISLVKLLQDKAKKVNADNLLRVTKE